nr:reverse transcriptase domain-containing protein [Tanacetum cinerariifolium]
MGRPGQGVGTVSVLLGVREDYTTPNEETETDLDSMARCEAKPKELESTYESRVRSTHDLPQTIPAYMFLFIVRSFDYFVVGAIPLMDPTRRIGASGDNVNPNIMEIITQQLQNIIPHNVTQEFLACKPRYFDGKGGAIVLSRWIKKMELVMDISGCVNNQKVKYAASSLINKALTWWNTQIQARGHEAALGMMWEEFKALLMEELCPSNEIEKLENEFLNHAMVGANHVAYIDRFYKLRQ